MVGSIEAHAEETVQIYSLGEANNRIIENCVYFGLHSGTLFGPLGNRCSGLDVYIRVYILFSEQLPFEEPEVTILNLTRSNLQRQRDDPS